MFVLFARFTAGQCSLVWICHGVVYPSPLHFTFLAVTAAANIHVQVSGDAPFYALGCVPSRGMAGPCVYLCFALGKPGCHPKRPHHRLSRSGACVPGPPHLTALGVGGPYGATAPRRVPLTTRRAGVSRAYLSRICCGKASVLTLARCFKLSRWLTVEF